MSAPLRLDTLRFKDLDEISRFLVPIVDRDPEAGDPEAIVVFFNGHAKIGKDGVLSGVLHTIKQEDKP